MSFPSEETEQIIQEISSKKLNNAKQMEDKFKALV
jgi:hypothetical protein